MQCEGPRKRPFAFVERDHIPVTGGSVARHFGPPGFTNRHGVQDSTLCNVVNGESSHPGRERWQS
jgi:hypothetical protein